jgi:hypothetical protein
MSSSFLVWDSRLYLHTNICEELVWLPWWFLVEKMSCSDLRSVVLDHVTCRGQRGANHVILLSS